MKNNSPHDSYHFHPLLPVLPPTELSNFRPQSKMIYTQMEETGVSRFECPTCLAVRDIKPKGDRVKFPSHPKRMTTTPNQGSRWVKREIAWKLFDS